MRDLNYDLKRLQKAHDDGVHGTRTARSYALAQMADQLHDVGFKGLRATGLRRKHAVALVNEVEAPGRLHRHDEEQDCAPALVGDADRSAGRGAVEGLVASVPETCRPGGIAPWKGSRELGCVTSDSDGERGGARCQRGKVIALRRR